MNAALRLVGPNRSISSLSLREITREAGIAPNSFYRHFDSTEDLAISIINLAGSTLRTLIGQARVKAKEVDKGIVRNSVEIFIEQLYVDAHYLPTLLREGIVGTDRYKQAVRQQLAYFEQELTEDIISIGEKANGVPIYPELIAQAITRLVFAMGTDALDMPREKHAQLIDQMVVMIKMLFAGAHLLKKQQPSK
ncbi:TetR family transcriptional regulator [Reinekea thalattae]|uniref:TetR family transcriptional regulator n=2 Tax=Reinekea thalattae TaxID=2593301 RepID=A0A5C8ZBY0_9GAMM|nr:TetR family transcriptional regulator [Reinekea thalattae]